MSWAKLDDQLHAHPKAAEAGLEAMGLWTLALSWSTSYLTDGYIPDYQIARLGGTHKIAARLVVCELWERAENGEGYQIHDFHDYNPSAAKVRETRAARAAAGRAGGSNSHAGGRPPDGDDDGEEEQATEQAGNKQKTSKELAKNNPVPIPVPHPDPVPSTQELPATAGAPPPPPPPKSKQPKPPSLLDPDTPEARVLFARLCATAKAKGHRGPSKFETLEQKRDFLAAVEVLGDEFPAMLKKALSEGCTSRARAVAYLAGCARNKGDGRGRPKGATVTRAKLQQMAAGNPSPPPRPELTETEQTWGQIRGGFEAVMTKAQFSQVFGRAKFAGGNGGLEIALPPGAISGKWPALRDRLVEVASGQGVAVTFVEAGGGDAEAAA